MPATNVGTNNEKLAVERQIIYIYKAQAYTRNRAGL